MVSTKWVNIPGYPNYMANIVGEVKRVVVGKDGTIKERKLKSRNISRYSAYTLYDDQNKKKTVYIHQVIGLCFIEPPIKVKKPIVVHVDGDKSNNNIDNLKWMSFKDFMQGEFSSGRRSNTGLWEKRIDKYGPLGGERPPGRKSTVTPDQYPTIKKLYKRKEWTLKRLSEKFKCSPSHIFNIANKK